MRAAPRLRVQPELATLAPVLTASLLALSLCSVPLSPGGFVTEWRIQDRVVSWPGPMVDLAGFGPGKTRVVEAELFVVTPGAYSLRLGADGRATLRVNGAQVLVREGPYGALIDDREVIADLPAGVSRLAVALDAPKKGAARIVLRVVPMAAGAAITSALPTDTPDALSQRLPVSFSVQVEADGLWVTATVGPAATGTAAVSLVLAEEGPNGGAGRQATTHGESVALRTKVSGAGVIDVRLAFGAGGRALRSEVKRVRADVRAASSIAAARKGASEPGPGVDPDAAASAQWWASHLEAQLARAEKDTRLVENARIELDKAIEDLDPSRFEARTGAMLRAYISPLDGRPHSYAVYVPPGARPGLPLIVALHPSGYSPTRMLRSVLGLPSSKGMSRARLQEFLPTGAGLPAVVVAPWGFDGTGTRYIGKVDVLAVMDHVAHRHRTHPDRVLLTGGSLGGLGTWHLGLRMPDRFAAIEPVAGFGTVRDYANVRGKRVQPWERFLLERRDNLTFVENARHLPMRCVHGERDNPPRATVIVDRYNALGCPNTYVELPGIGHAAWDAAYADGAPLSLLRSVVRPTRPKRVDFVSGSYRHREAYWVTIDQFAATSALAKVSAEHRAAGVEVQTQNVKRLTLNLGRAPVPVRIDGTSVETASGPRHFQRGPSGFEASRDTPAPTEKRPGLSGPIDDIRYEPHVFVYGTLLADETDTNRRLAETLARYVPNDADIAVPVVADTAVTAALMTQRHLVLIGTPKGNQVLGQIIDRLPIQVGPEAVVVGGKRYAGPSVGVTFIAPNPLAPGKYVLVRTGTGRRGVWLSGWLPEWLPDYVVYDEGIAGQRGGYLMDQRRPLEAGYFSESWSAGP